MVLSDIYRRGVETDNRSMFYSRLTVPLSARKGRFEWHPDATPSVSQLVRRENAGVLAAPIPQSPGEMADRRETEKLATPDGLGFEA